MRAACMPAIPPPTTRTRRGEETVLIDREVSNVACGLAAHPFGTRPRSSRGTCCSRYRAEFLRSRLDQLAHVVRISVEGAGQRNVLEAFFLHDGAGEFRIIEPLRDTHRDAVADDLSDCGCIRHEPSLGRLGTLKH